MDITLETILDLAYSQAARVLVDQPAGVQIVPTFLIQTSESSIILMQTPWRSERDKDLMCRSLGETMRDRGAQRYSFLSEAWMSVSPRDGMSLEEIAKKRFTEAELPSNDPNRIEVVMTMAADHETSLHKLYRIIRGEAGTVVRLDYQKDLVATPFSGRFANLLKGSDIDG